MVDLGIRLQLLVGSTVPLPAPFAVVDALREIEVINTDRGRDGFELKLAIGKDSQMNYGLLASGILDPPNRVIIMVIVNALPQVLIDGIITQHEMVLSNEPGRSILDVKGEDISARLDLEEKKKTFANQKDSDIVGTILRDYATYGLRPDVKQTDDTPSESERKPTQHGTDLEYVQALARKNGFVFYVEPTDVPGFTTAHWGPDKRQGASQPALTMNMGAATNVDQPMVFRFDALGPVAPQLSIIEPTTKRAIPVPLPASLNPSLSSQAASPLRKTQSSSTANLSLSEAVLRALSASMGTGDAVVATGEIDAVRYGRVLRARRPVEVRGAGRTYDGTYYVQRVTHRIRRGQYKQSFTLKREGRGATSNTVAVTG
jgi:hypothetical protein